MNVCLRPYSARTIARLVSIRHAHLDSYSPKVIQRDYQENALPLANQVFVSRHTDVYTNLAFEHWLFRQKNLNVGQRSLLMWIDKPCVVIGRHQNPWQEANVTECDLNHVAIARRNSGGGTVFHDAGNLNISFLTHRKDYDRKRNLRFLSDTLRNHFGLETQITCREDLVLSKCGRKISGTASKLTHDASYHHCTLLIHSDLDILRKCLKKQNNNIESNATKSIPSPVTNLQSLLPQLTVEQVIQAIRDDFCAWQNAHVADVDTLERHLHTNQEVFEISSELKSWDWVYGKTPRFVIKHEQVADQKYECLIHVQKGRIEKISINPNTSACALDDLVSTLINLPLTQPEVESTIDQWLTSNVNIQALFFKQLILKTLESAYF